ncbi:MAG: hypothetical protein NVSMB2_06220 [Chloroflexota bacterium]
MVQPRALARETVVYVALLGAAVWLFWPVLSNAVENWASIEELNFGFLVPPVLLALVWWRRHSIKADATGHAVVGAGSGHGEGHNAASSAPGLAVAAAGIAGFVLAERFEARSPAAVMAGLAIWGAVLYLWGWRIAREEALPIAVLTFALSLQQTLISPLAFWLQGVTANAANIGAHGIGLQIVQEGLLLRGDRYAFIVADTCSGMNSLLALVTLTGLLLYVARGTFSGRLGVLASVLPLVMVANTVRVITVLWVADRFDQDTALGFFHGASSLVLFGLSLAGLFLAARVFGCQTIAAD